jgi:predicted  nucleic acid-binding Zn-ribbon protein
MHSWKHIGNTLFVVAVIGTTTAITYVNREKFVPLYETFTASIGLDKPCSKPIIYYIEDFNPKFGQTQEEFRDNLQKASSIWNNAYGKELFRYSREDADKMFDLSKRKLQVNLIYDHRQETTEQLKTIGSTIDSSKDSYENQKALFDSLKSQYENKKQSVQNLITQYESDKAIYQKEVAYWNTKGGAPKQQYAELEKKRTQLNNAVQTINKQNQELNELITKLNSQVVVLNSMNKDINQKISTFNNVSQAVGPEFQEGEFVIDDFGQRINIYEFKDQNKLIRVLAHEFGHALGIDHVDGEDSIMNAYNNASATNLSEQDLTALKAVCLAK